jgi:branched-subunit amino acid aminotransferase/4-amino-4-deoxychorismate lyase
VSRPGLFETMRVRGGGLPFLDRHLARLERSAASVGLPRPSAVLRDVARERAEAGDPERILRLAWSSEGAAWTERELGPRAVQQLVTVGVRHDGYPVKSEDRRVFDRAQLEAAEAGGTEPLLLTRDGMVAEASRYAVLWLDGTALCCPAPDLDVLPSIGLARVREIAASLGMATRAIRAPRSALDGRPLWLVNAVRGLVHSESLDRRALPPSDALRQVARAFWPDA